MSDYHNKYGLSRYIPSEVAREVRQACGFGCIECGKSLVQYEHIDPEFHMATEHEADNIALLCGSCHDYVTRKVWSKERIKRARLAPYCLREGFSWGELDLGLEPPVLHFAGSIITNCEIPIRVKDIPLISIKGSEASGLPFRLTANFCDSNGIPVLNIKDNIWQTSSHSWDVELKAGRMVIRQQDGGQILALHTIPPNRLEIERLEMRVGQIDFRGSPDLLEIRRDGGRFIPFTGIIMDGCTIGFEIE